MRAVRAAVTGAVILAAVSCGSSARHPAASVTAPRSPGSATSSPVSTAVPTGTTGPKVVAAPPGPLGVRVQSVTFASASRGWLLGTSAGRVRVEQTADGGRHWQPLVAVPSGQVTGIRFADTNSGYAFSRDALDLTGDGGKSWRRIALPDEDGPADGSGAAQVEISDGIAWALNAAAPYPSIWAAPAGSSAFRRLGASGNRGDYLAAEGRFGYVLGMAGAGPIAPNLVTATLAGTGPARPLPCPETRQVVDAVALTPLTTTGGLALGCAPSSEPTQTVLFSSANGGASWQPAGTVPGRVDSLTRTSSAIVAATAEGSVYRLALRSGATAVQLLAGHGFQYVGFTNDEDGVAISGNAVEPGSGGTLFVTHDAGAHWTTPAT